MGAAGSAEVGGRAALDNGPTFTPGLHRTSFTHKALRAPVAATVVIAACPRRRPAGQRESPRSRRAEALFRFLRRSFASATVVTPVNTGRARVRVSRGHLQVPVFRHRRQPAALWGRRLCAAFRWRLNGGSTGHNDQYTTTPPMTHRSSMTCAMGSNGGTSHRLRPSTPPRGSG